MLSGIVSGLYENSKFARTHFLLCIANEELGKSLIVTSAIVDLIAEKIDWHKFWKRLRNHKDKTRMIEHAENILVSSDENFTVPENIQKLIPVLEELKMASLYSDMFQNNFFEPNELIPQFMVAPYHRLTGNRLEFFSSIAASDETLRYAKKEDILKFQSIAFVHGKGRRKSEEQRNWESLDELRQKWERYETSLEIMGDTRNSYFKTDPDATFILKQKRRVASPFGMTTRLHFRSCYFATGPLSCFWRKATENVPARLQGESFSGIMKQITWRGSPYEDH